MPLPGATERTNRTSEIKQEQGSFPIVQDQNWHLGPPLAVAPNEGRIERLGSPNLLLSVLHTDTQANKCVYMECGLILLTSEEADDIGTGGNLTAPIARRVFHLQRWLQSGTQPPLQTQRMGKMITLNPDVRLNLAYRAGTVQGPSLANADLGYAYRASQRDSFVGG